MSVPVDRVANAATPLAQQLDVEQQTQGRGVVGGDELTELDGGPKSAVTDPDNGDGGTTQQRPGGDDGIGTQRPSNGQQPLDQQYPGGGNPYGRGSHEHGDGGGHYHGGYGGDNDGRSGRPGGPWNGDGRNWRGGGDDDRGTSARPGNGGPYGRGPGDGAGNNSRPGGFDPTQSQAPNFGGGKGAGGFDNEFTHPLSTTLGQLGRLASNLFTPGNSPSNPPGGSTHHYEPANGGSQYGGGQIRDHQAAPPMTQQPAGGTYVTDRGGGTPVRPDGGAHGTTGNNTPGSPAGMAQQAGRNDAALPMTRDAAAANAATARGAETAAGTAQAQPGQPTQLQAGVPLSTMQAAALQTLAAAQGLLLQEGAEEHTLPQQGTAQNPRGDALARELLRGTPTQLPTAPNQLAPGQQAEERTLPNTLADPRRQAQAEQAQTRAATDADAQARADQRADARNLANPRAAEALVRTDANDPRLTREAAEKTRNTALSEGLRAQQTDASSKRPGLLAAMAESGSLRGSATALARHALDWVGQLAKELGLGASDEEEGVHAMRVVAGLVIAAIGVLLAIGAIYALRVILHGG